MASDDYAASITTAGKLQLGSISTGTNEVWTDADWFKIRLTAGTAYSFEAAHTSSTRDSDSSVFLDVYDAAGNAAAATIRKTWAGSIATFTPAISGDYYVGVRGNLATTLAVDYTLRAATLPAADVGNTPATAGILELDKKLTGKFEALPDIDTYAAVLEAGTTYAVTPDWGSSGTNGSAPGLIRVLGPDGEYIMSNVTYGGTAFSFSSTKAGTYYISAAASNSTGHTGDYTLKLSKPEDDFGATAARAGALTVGQARDGVMEATFDRDWFSVELVAGKTYWLTLSNTYDRFFPHGELQLMDASGNLLATDAGQVSQSSPLLISYVPEKSGTYYLQATDTTGAPGRYQVAAKEGTPDDYGDTNASAGSLLAGSAVDGKTQYGGDKDVFKVAVQAGTTYLFELKAGTAANMSWLTLSGADAKGTANGLVSHTAPEFSGYLSYTASYTGDYYVTAASGNSQREIAYTLTATVPAADDYASSSATTGVLAAGAARVGGAIDYRGDADWFKLKVTAGNKYIVRLDGVGNGGTLAMTGNKSTVELHHGAAMDWLTPLGGLDGAYYGFIALKDEDLYLAVRPGPYPYSESPKNHITGSYFLSMADVTADKTAPVLTGLSPGNGARYASPTASIGIEFNESIRLGSGEIRLLGQDGAVIQSWKSTDYSGLRLLDGLLLLDPWSALQPGQTYFVDMPAGSILDLAGNAFPGTSQYHFTTAPVVAASTSGNDFLAGTGTGKRIDGGAGIDTVVFDDNRKYYLLERKATETKVTSGNTTELPGDTLTGVERLKFRDASVALDIDGNGGQAYRMYQAALNRTPDKAGLGYWMERLDHGGTLAGIAQDFLSSAEAQALYGAAPTDLAFLTSMYSNVLHRAPDSAGLAYWLGILHGGNARAEVLAAFSESPENQAALLTIIGNGFDYTPFG